MALQYSTQYNGAYNTEPKINLSPDKLNGRIRRIYAEFTLTAEILASGANDLTLAKLPANAVIIEARLIAPGGSAGTLALGWLAGDSEAADSDGIMAAIAGNSAVDEVLEWTDAAFNKRFSEEVDIVLSSTVDSAGWSGDKVELELRYVID